MALTWARVAAAPVVVLLLLDDGAGSPWRSWLAAMVFILASITDALDGYFARRFNAMSNLGKFMDPIADKVIVSSVLVMLIQAGNVSPIAVLLILGRDLLVGGFRSAAAADGLVIDAKAAGKWKTGVQMVAIPVLILAKHLTFLPSPLSPELILMVGQALLWFSVVLSLGSGVSYARLYFASRSNLGKSTAAGS